MTKKKNITIAIGKSAGRKNDVKNKIVQASRKKKNRFVINKSPIYLFKKFIFILALQCCW